MATHLFSVITSTTVALALSASNFVAPPPPIPLADLDVFVSGVGGYHTYRIPAIAQTKSPGTLLLFCEGRKLNSEDHDWNDIVMRRSTDGGQTWSSLVMIHSESNATSHVTIGNPAPIVDDVTGRVWLFFSRNNREVGVLSSDDEGLTWSPPRELSSSLMKPHGWTSIFTGLNVGISLHRGGDASARRLIVCCNHDGPETNRYSSSIYSDDGGVTWLAGHDVSPTGSTECSITATPEGVWMYSRLWNQGKGPLHTYGIAKSSDGGVTFDQLTPGGITWPQPDCEGTMRVAPSTTGGDPCFLLTAPFGTARANMTLSASCGREPGVWVHERTLWGGQAAYSAMDVASDGKSVYIAYERGTHSPYETIHVTQIANKFNRN